jgi:DNA-binding SARP family transcriptional activator
VLGPLEVCLADGRIAFRAPKERAVLEMLALRAGQPIATESLWSGLWGDSAPPSAAKVLQSHISHLRHVLPAGAIVTKGSGYVLPLERGAVDASRFEECVQEAGRQQSDGNLAQAAGALRQALSLWRGQPCPELTEHSWATAAVARLEELRRQAEDDLADVRLALGEHDRLVGDLEAGVA